MNELQPIFVSLIYYLCIFIICELSRRIVVDVTGIKHPTIRTVILEFLGTLQVCACVYENHLVTRSYGIRAFFLVVFLLLNFHRLTTRGALISPSLTIERWVSGILPTTTAAAILSSQVVGGLCAFRLARRIWWIELSRDHALQAQRFDCILRFRASLLTIAIYEFAVCFLMRTIIGFAFRKHYRFAPYITSAFIAIGLSTELAFFGAAGLNPTIAFSRMFGCEGLNSTGHFLVFWVPAISGWMMSYFLERGRPFSSISIKKD